MIQKRWSRSIASKSNILGNILQPLGRKRKFTTDVELVIKSLPDEWENP